LEPGLAINVLGAAVDIDDLAAVGRVEDDTWLLIFLLLAFLDGTSLLDMLL
jgi:hypothetical protein